MYSRKLSNQNSSLNRKFFTLVSILTITGLIVVADASAPQAVNVFSDRFYFVKQQFIWVLIGYLGMAVTYRIPYRFWNKISGILFYFNLLLLVLVLFPQIGSKVMGARRWIIIGSLSIQPSEAIKFTTALYLARLYSKNITFLKFVIPIGVVALLIMLQPDFGTTIIFCAMAFGQLFAAGFKMIYLGLIGVLGGIISACAIYFSDYRKERFLTFLRNTEDPLGASYHIRQVLLSLGLGGFWGVGLGQSRQKYLYLPEAATDSIFAVIAEEVGFIGSLLVIILFLLFIVEGFKIASKAPDLFSQMTAVGLVCWIGIQIVLNIGSMVALVPLTGVPLPFISYGGSSLVMILISVGILLNISKYGNYRRDKR